MLFDHCLRHRVKVPVPEWVLVKPVNGLVVDYHYFTFAGKEFG
jgi:hypothetical protein